MALPTVKESAGELRTRLRSEKDLVRKDRLQLLYSIKTGLVRTRIEAAELLGKNRNTIGRWLSIYEREGLDALLSIQNHRNN